MKSRQKDQIFSFETNTILSINMYQIIWNKIPNKYSKFLIFFSGIAKRHFFLSPHVEGINYPSEICVGKNFTISNKTYLFLFPCFEQKKRKEFENVNFVKRSILWPKGTFHLTGSQSCKTNFVFFQNVQQL